MYKEDLVLNNKIHKTQSNQISKNPFEKRKYSSDD